MTKEYHTPFLATSTMSDKEHAYCSCILSVSMKQSDECLKSGGKAAGCVVPYAVCNSRFHLGRVECSKDYDFARFDAGRLRAYVLLHGVPTNKDVNSMNEQEMLQAIAAWKGAIGH